MRRIGLLPCVVVAGAVLLVGLFSTPESRLSIRMVHPRSAQLMEDIETGQTYVPATYEVVELDAAAPAREDDRLLVSQAEELTQDEFASVQLLPTPDGQKMYLELTDEGVAEVYQLVEQHPDGKLVMITESGEAIPVRLSKSNPAQGRLTVQLGRNASYSDVRKLMAELREDI